MKKNDRNKMLALHLDDAHPRTSQNDAPGPPETLTAENSQIPNVSSEESMCIRKRHSCYHSLSVPKRDSIGHKSQHCRTLTPHVDLRQSAMESDCSGAENGLFSKQYTFKPKRTSRKRNLTASPSRQLPKVPCHRSPDSFPESVTKFNLKKFFERRGKQRKLRAKACEAREISSKPQNQSQDFCNYIPPTRHHRRWKDEADRFPFLDQKDLTFKMIFTYEQASLWGFLHHIEKLKYNRHLQESLRNLNASDVSDDGPLDARAYRYLDDDGPISPILDVDCSNATEPPVEYDAKVVDNSCFILNWNPSVKKKVLKKRKKNLKHGKRLEQDQKDDVSKLNAYHERTRKNKNKI